ncbi:MULTISPECIES: low molecular weight protein tyrosine phosphatase family protein [Burkholderia]|uniref:low molecular weight protein tyrosine phosphatase family protein n=1 Tax=Burkholderia TaxID=32008 RepID=UPI000B79B172|nr:MULTISPECIES: low molecular weight protein tyrosine phosphatase family protein [Burkholderia]MBY4724413.1 low molecular weight protein tyrosine phosphatase family protein [Burkholderia contaminans]MCI3970373.1 low molecular weight protein tyrosine phosphatase family protein [Burkholderia sp. HI4860]MDN7790859.1 low molecular weight protein tyrosine phosphatase family protein [Burkholderia contaminans]OXJ04844.1 phosphotyrosine protein phosphatase [Burkholderia sp. AU33647]
MTRAGFVCSRNRLRSPTAEAVFAARPGVETGSAGLAPDADTRVSAEQLDWADVVFVMEHAHKARLAAQFGAHLRHKKIVCLDLPDRSAGMQPERVTLLERKAGPFLRT